MVEHELKITMWLTKAHKSYLEQKGLIRYTRDAWFELELAQQRFGASEMLIGKRDTEIEPIENV